MVARRVRTAVFQVGGLGTRFLPATKAMPKEMLTVVDKPLIHHAVEEASRAGIEQFIFVTGRHKSAIEDHFDYSFELEQALLDRQKTRELEELRSWVFRGRAGSPTHASNSPWAWDTPCGAPANSWTASRSR